MRGQIAKSQDLSGAVMLLFATLLVAMGGWWIHERFLAVMSTLLDFGRFENGLRTEVIGPSFLFAMGQVALIATPVLIAASVAAYFSQVIQVGWLFTLKPVQPKLSALNPVAGIKKIFGLKGQVKTVTNAVKMVVMIVVAVLAIMVRLKTIGALPMLEARDAMRLVVRMAIELAIILCLLLVFIALFDYLYQRWQHTRDLMMTKQEVKDERRSMEGDPQIKGKRFQMYQQIVMQQIASAVPKADVVINNPEHFSVAIKYDPDEMAAPTVVAKGADYVAFRIRQVAQANNVPMIVRPPLARALYRGTQVGDEIAPEHYEAVAEILAYVYKIDERARRQQPAGVN